jgi:hypothetical protein
MYEWGIGMDVKNEFSKMQCPQFDICHSFDLKTPIGPRQMRLTQSAHSILPDFCC